jgi:hypothetical protein
MSQCYIIKEPSFLLLLNSTHKQVAITDYKWNLCLVFIVMCVHLILIS